MMPLLFLMGRMLYLLSFHEINFEGVQDHTEGGKHDVRHNNINVTYGYAKQGFESEANKDGFHSPSILKNIKSKPLLLNLTLMRSIMISCNLFHACTKYS